MHTSEPMSPEEPVTRMLFKRKLFWFNPGNIWNNFWIGGISLATGHQVALEMGVEDITVNTVSGTRCIMLRSLETSKSRSGNFEEQETYKSGEQIPQVYPGEIQRWLCRFLTLSKRSIGTPGG